jgi:hypothetical protein
MAIQKGILLVAGLVGLLACSPVALLRPSAAPSLENDWEMGAAVALLGPRPYVQESWRGTGQTWITGRLGQRFALSGVVAFDDEAAVAGAALRFDYLLRDRFVGGAELEGGWAFIGLSLPSAVRIFGDAWVYVAPRLGTFGDEISGSATAGFSLPVYEGLYLRAEGRVGWAAFKYYNRRVHLSGGLAYQW